VLKESLRIEEHRRRRKRKENRWREWEGRIISRLYGALYIVVVWHWMLDWVAAHHDHFRKVWMWVGEQKKMMMMPEICMPLLSGDRFTWLDGRRVDM
jgi:hypothetical protein